MKIHSPPITYTHLCTRISQLLYFSLCTRISQLLRFRAFFRISVPSNSPIDAQKSTIYRQLQTHTSPKLSSAIMILNPTPVGQSKDRLKLGETERGDESRRNGEPSSGCGRRLIKFQKLKHHLLKGVHRAGLSSSARKSHPTTHSGFGSPPPAMKHFSNRAGIFRPGEKGNKTKKKKSFADLASGQPLEATWSLLELKEREREREREGS